MYNSALLKNVKPATPEKYSADDDIEVFEAWLAGLLRWFRVTGITGEDNDQLRIDLSGTTMNSVLHGYGYTRGFWTGFSQGPGMGTEFLTQQKTRTRGLPVTCH